MDDVTLLLVWGLILDLLRETTVQHEACPRLISLGNRSPSVKAAHSEIVIVTLNHIFSILVGTGNGPSGMNGTQDFQAVVFMQSSSHDEAPDDDGGAPSTHAWI